MIELSIVLPVRNEQDNLARLLPRLHSVLSDMNVNYEIIVVDGNSTDGSVAIARQNGAVALLQEGEGYGPALAQGIAAAKGEYILSLDADLSHEPDFIAKLWLNRKRAEVIIASRYCTGGVAYAPLFRRVLSRILNAFFRWGLQIPVRDLSSGFRLYRAAAVKGLILRSRSFEVLEEVLIRAYAEGWRVLEVPFTYFPRQEGRSNARIIPFGLRLLATFFEMWALRNSVDTADYDQKAFYSRIPLQRYWHRKRHQIIMNMARGQGRTLDVGCGSSVTTLSLNRAVGVDVQLNKLRYLSGYGVPLVNASATALPFVSEIFDCVVCSQVLPYVSCAEIALKEAIRVLKPGGRLVVGVPDYSTIGWRLIEPLYRMVAPRGYSTQTRAKYTREDLERLASSLNLIPERRQYVFRSELIMPFRKPSSAEKPIT